MSDSICPHCGKRLRDLSELFGGSSFVETECPHCEGRISVELDIRYEVRPLEAEEFALEAPKVELSDAGNEP